MKKQILFFLGLATCIAVILTVVLILNSNQNIVQAVGEVATYSFNEGSGTTAADTSGNSRNGTLTNGPVWTTGKYGNALSFDGVNDNVTLPSSLDIASLPFSVEAWINPINYSDWHAIFTKRSSWSASAVRFDIGLAITTGNIYLTQPNSNLAFSYAPSLNTWTHIAVVANTSGTQLYVNGTLNQTLGVFILGTGASAPAMIGNNGDLDDPFAGKIDEVRVYSRALTQSEIQTDMNTPIGGTPTPDTQVPTTPTNLSASGVSSSQINLSWTASSDNVGVTGYRVYRCQGSGCTPSTQIGTSASNSYSDSGLSASTVYVYRIIAYDAAGNSSSQSTSVSATTLASGSLISYGLEWPGNGAVRRMLYWSNPFPIYDATYIFKVYPRKKIVPTNSPTGYYTTFFWGNNGNFVWDGGSCNTYYGAHPYPIPAPNGPGQWEISVYCSDPVTGTEVQWDRWYTQALRVWRESSSITHHEFYYDLPDTNKVLTYTANSSSWANKNPPNPAIVIGQAPNYNGASWGGYPGWEEFNGIIRGIQIYSNDLSLADIQSEINSPKSTTAGQNSIWYLNTDPRPTDVSDKKAAGTIHNPSWDGTTALEWSSGATSDTQAPTTPTNLTATAVSSSQINLSWTASSDNVGVTGYRLERCQGSACTTFAQIAAPTGTSYSDSGLTANTTYRYRTRAADAAGNLSSYSSIASATTQAQSSGGIPSSLGWYQIPNTNLQSVCPPDNYGGTSYPFYSFCRYVTEAWSSGVFDTLRNRLIIWGGGHNDYYGNEIYAINLNTLSVSRLTDPGLPLASSCVESIAGGTQPNSRHTYDGITYLPNIDKMFVFGGAPACPPGAGSNGTWMFNFSTNTWEKKNPSGTIPTAPVSGVSMTAYDPNTNKVFVHDTAYLYSYDIAANSFQQLSYGTTDYHLTGVIDPVRKKFVLLGGGQQWIYDISTGSTYAIQNLNSTGGSAIVNGNYPGLAYDPVTDRIVAWSGGNTVYSLNLDTKVWTPITYLGGPGAALGNGTNKRWSYSLTSGVFVVYNYMSDNAFTFRLSSGSSDTTPPAVSLIAPSSGSTVSGSSVTVSANASDNVAVVGVQFKLDGVNLGSEDATSPYSIIWNTMTASNGSHTLTATARDAAGLQTTSAGITVTVNNTDGQAPTTPTNFSATAISSSQINLSWTVSTDNVGVTGYRIYRGGTQIGTSATNSYSNTGLSPSTSYSYTVQAYDAAGNNSAQSSPASATTQASTPPPTGTQVTSFQLTSGISGTLPFTVGLGFKKGDVPNTPVLDITGTQVTVKSRWSDNSVKHAIASGRVALTANTPKTINVLSSSPTSGTNLTSTDIQAANPSASVSLGSYGTVNLSNLLSNPFRTWVSGPEMVEAHYRSQVGSDPTLVVWFYVQLYKGGQMKIRVVVENGYLDISTSNKTYVPTVTIGGATIYNNGGASLSHYAHTRWTQEGWIGTSDPQITIKLDTNYLEDSKLVPNYFDKTPSATVLNSLYQTYAPMQGGDWTPSMGNAGFQEQIGLLPNWDALYISSGGDSRAYKSVISNSKALNSYPIIWNDSATKLPVMPSNRPTWTTQGASGGGSGGETAGTLTWEMAHHPSGGYLAYLITGDYYFLETMEDQSAMCYLSNSSSAGSGTSRIFSSQTRAVAWCIRTVSQMAGLAPQTDQIANDYRSLLAKNMVYWKSVKDSLGGIGLGYLYEYGANGVLPYGNGQNAPWQQHFWIQSLGMGSDLEPLTDMSVFNEVRDFMYKGSVGILGDISGFCYTYAGDYNLKISSQESLDPATWYKTWNQVFSTTHPGVTSCGTTLQGSSGGDPSAASYGYWGNLMPAIAYAVDDGYLGASSAWARLTGATNWSTVENSGFDDIPIWGIVPRSPSSPPPTDTTPPSAPTGVVVVN